MSNRKNQKTKRKGPARAPADVPFGPEGDEALPTPPRLALARTALKIVLGAGLVLGVALTLGWGLHRYAVTTPRFAIEDIKVDGARRLGRTLVLSLGGIRAGANVFTLDVEKAEKAILANPWVESVKVTRRLPGHVRVELRERVPQALLVLGTRTLLVSSDGVPFKELGADDPHDLPVMTGLSEKGLGRDAPAELGRLTEALGLLGDYERLSVAAAYPVEELHLDERGHVTLTVGSQGVALHLGAPPYKQKLMRAVRVLGKVEGSSAEPGVVFLDNEAHPERVVVRVK